MRPTVEKQSSLRFLPTRSETPCPTHSGPTPPWKNGGPAPCSLRRALPDDSRDLASLDPAAIQEEAANAWPRIRDADELHDALLSLGILPEKIALKKDRETGSQEVAQWFQDLVNAGRAYRLGEDDSGAAWVATETLAA